jgi:neutral ceramidase
MDNVPIGSKFGKVLAQPNGSYSKGTQASVRFQGATPRVSFLRISQISVNNQSYQNNLRLEKTFLTVERKDGNNWVTYRTDSHPSTKYNWKRTNGLLGYSEVTITWDIESDAPSGTYRITYYGDSKNGLTGKISAFTGSSNEFTVS